jgi:hypothetical protein
VPEGGESTIGELVEAPIACERYATPSPVPSSKGTWPFQMGGAEGRDFTIAQMEPHGHGVTDKRDRPSLTIYLVGRLVGTCSVEIYPDMICV